MAVLILGNEKDDHAASMLQILRARGADVELFDSASFPTQMQITYAPAENRGSVRLDHGRWLPFEEISAVYWRCYDGAHAPELPDPEQAYMAQNDSRGLFESTLITLPARWVNSYRAFMLHQTKPVQLAMVAALGVTVPDTVLTNDPAEVREFVESHPNCIFKPVQGGALTRPVTARHLTDETLKNLAVAPVTLQEEIAGTDVRVFVCGDKVMACELATEALDFRDDPDPHIEPIALPDDIVAQSQRIARQLSLLWTGIDFRRTKDGRHVFFEANPSPMFMGFEAQTGLPLSDSLADLLTAV